MAEVANAGGRLRGRAWSALVWALVLNGLLLVGTVFFVVIQVFSRSEPEFVAKPALYLPQRELEHRVAVSELVQAMSKPVLVEKLTTASLLPSNLPPLPALPDANLTPVEADDFLAQNAQALLGQSGLLGAAGGLRGAASTASFFGIEDAGERIVLVVNTSASVLRRARNRGVTIERIQEEVLGLVGGLPSGSLFGIVQFSQGVALFADYLAPATEANKAAARAWVPARLHGNPRVREDARLLGHEAALEAALRLEPDVVFLVTDGQLERRERDGERWVYPKIPYSEFIRTVRGFRRGQRRDVRIHVVGFEMTDGDAEDMGRLAREFRGQVRSF